MSPGISSHSEYPHGDRQFTRQRLDRLRVELESSPPPIRTWGPDFIAGVILVLAMIASFWLPDFLVWWVGQ